jgi:type II secretory pathway component GspD/PulD (secretin)
MGAALWVGGPSTWREIIWERFLGGASAESLRSDDEPEQDRKDEHSYRASNSDRGPRYASGYLEQESARFEEDQHDGNDESLLNLRPGRTARANSSRDARYASRRSDARVVRSEPSYTDQEADRPVRQHRVASPERSRGAARRPDALQTGFTTEAARLPEQEPPPVPRQETEPEGIVPAKRTAEPTSPLRPATANERIVLNFQNAPWEVVLKRFADEAGLALQWDALPPSTFSYNDPRGHTLIEAIDLFNGFLYSSGYLLIRNRDLLSVVKFSPESPIPTQMLPLVSPFDLNKYGRNEFLSIEVPLTTLDPVTAAKEVQGLLSPQGRVIPLSSAQRIVVTDFGGNLQQLFEMLWEQETDPANQPQLIFRLKNIPATEAAKAINEYLVAQRQNSSSITSAITSRAALATGQVGVAGNAASNFNSADAVVVAEPKTNSILVGASNRYLDRIRGLIQELDSTPPQVFIQALLVEVDLGNTDEFGVELGAQDSVLFDRSVIDNILTVTETTSNPATGIATTNQTIVSQTAEPGFNFNNKPLGNNTAIHPSKVGSQGLGNFGLGRVNGDLGYGGLVLSAGSESVSVLLRALSTKRKIDILSRPQIRTLDSREAEIQIGQQVPVVDGVSLTPVGSANPVIRQDQAGIILKVMPRISPLDEIMIEVKAEKSEFRTAPGSGIPIFTDATNGNVIEAPIKDVSKVSTMVSCMAGQTIVLGGMITKGHSTVERKVPILGDIPVLGWLFRYDNEQIQRKELLIFLTPHVLRNPCVSDEHLELETSRMHFPTEDAAQIHGPDPAPPEPIQPRGIKFPTWPYVRRGTPAAAAETLPPTAPQDPAATPELNRNDRNGAAPSATGPLPDPPVAPPSSSTQRPWDLPPQSPNASAGRIPAESRPPSRAGR